MATIRDVANLAGVSIATVSRVINQNSTVKPKSRRAVEEAIARLDYVPNKLGISLRQSKSNVILVLMNSISTSINAEVVEGIARCASQYDYRIVLGNTQADPQIEQKYYEMAKTRQADGVILLSPANEAEVINEYADYFPMVRCGLAPIGAKTPVVVVNDVKATYEAVQYLISLGNRNIVYLGMGDMVSNERKKGYCQALSNAKLPIMPDRMVDGDYSYTGNYSIIENVLKKNQVDAVFCATDVLAFATIRVAHQLGLSVPEDISVIGFDDSPLSSLFIPSLTTVHQDAYQIGFLAMKKLHLMLESEHQVDNEITYVDSKLIIRESTILRI